MSLSLALNTAISGLNANQQSLNVLSQNIANVNTAGYSKEVVTQSAVFINGVGAGVSLDGIVRKVDMYLQKSVQNQGSSVQTTKVVSDYYNQLQQLIGQPGAGNSIDSYLTTFFNGLQNLSSNSETTSLRSSAVSAAQTLSSAISNLAHDVESMRLQADTDINASVNLLNQTLDNLSSVNVAIQLAYARGQSTAGLLDQRDTALRTIAENMDISTSFMESGAVNVVTGSGVSLVDGGIRHQLTYAKAQSVDSFIADDNLGALSVITIGPDGKQSGPAQVLITAGQSADVTSVINSGKIQGLQDLRDHILPSVLDQLDMLASRLRDSVNAVQNNGSGFPPASTLTGDRLVSTTEASVWSGSLTLAVLQADGSSAPSAYPDETETGIRAQVLDLSALDYGQGPGVLTVQNVIDEINNNYAGAGNKIEVGGLNNIQLVSDTSLLPSGAISLFNFDLNAENISSKDGLMFVNGISVTDSAGTVMTSVTQDPTNVLLSSANTYVTHAGTGTVDISLQSISGLKTGDKIFLNGPSVGSVDGISQAQLTGYFTITAMVGSQITISTTGTATTGTAVSDAGAGTLVKAYQSVPAGSQVRAQASSPFQVDLTANTTSLYYDIGVNVSVMQEDGTIKQSVVTYRVLNNEKNLYNDRYNARTATDDGVIVPPAYSQNALRAVLVDKNGNEMPKVNGQYNGQGYLKIVASTNTNTIAINEGDSKQVSDVNGVPGSGWGLSHYFGLNNFFESNEASSTGDTVKNSALYLKVQQRLIDNPNLVSSGQLVQSDPNGTPPDYTMVRHPGDNSVIQKMADLAASRQVFDAAGGLPTTTMSLSAYTSELIGYVSSKTASASSAAANAQTLYDGFKGKADASSGVNLDEELANTVTYQNAYSATARVITVVNQMFDALLQVV